jgi:hypothetical protein
MESGIEVQHQSSYAQEVKILNGIEKRIYVVIKNQPFYLNLQLRNFPAGIGFRHLVLNCELIFDTELMKSVGFVKTRPLDWRLAYNSESDSCAMLECRPSVLSSKQGNMLFRIKMNYTIRGVTATGESFALSEALKVISKPEKSGTHKKRKKRTLNDVLVDTLDRIQMQQENQFMLIQQLRAQTELNHAHAQPSVQPELVIDRTLNEQEKWEQREEEALDPEQKFERAIAEMIERFADLEPSRRAVVIRRIATSQQSEQQRRLIEFVHTFQMEALGEMPGHHLAPVELTTREIEAFYSTLVDHDTPLL